MKTRFIALFSFLALFLSLSVSAHFKEFEHMDRRELKTKLTELHGALHEKKKEIVSKILRKHGVTGEQIKRIAERAHPALMNFHKIAHLGMMKFVKKLLKEEDIPKHTIKAIMLDFKRLKAAALKCLIDCCEKHKAMIKEEGNEGSEEYNVGENGGSEEEAAEDTAEPQPTKYAPQTGDDTGKKPSNDDDNKPTYDESEE
jgi:hypothetical protein